MLSSSNFTQSNVSQHPKQVSMRPCDELAILSVKGWSTDKLLKRENLCFDALKARGITSFVPSKNTSPLNQLSDMYAYLLKKARIIPSDKENTEEMTLKAAEWTALLIRIRRRWGRLTMEEQNYIIQRGQEDPFYRALAMTATEGILHYPQQIQQIQQVQQVQQVEPVEQFQQVQQKQQVGGDTSIIVPLAICKEKLESLEQVEKVAQQYRKERSELLKVLKKSNDPKEIIRELAILEANDKKLRQKRKRVIKELKNCKSNEEQEGYKCLALLENAKKRLESFSEENDELVKTNNMLLATRNEYEDTMTALAAELQKVRLENYYQQEVILQLQRELVKQSGDSDAAKEDSGDKTVSSDGQLISQAMSTEMSSESDFDEDIAKQAKDQRNLEEQLIRDRTILNMRLEEAKQMRKNWDTILEKRQAAVQKKK